MKKYKLLYITNIPTPYRNKRFNLMEKILPKKGINFDVYYMAENEPNRKWKIDYKSIAYKYKIFKGIHPTIGGMFAHFNPGLFIALQKESYDIVVVGGMGCPSHWLAPYFVKKDVKKILSVESNLDSVEVVKGIGAWIKKKLIQKYNAYQVTGDRSIEYLKFFSPNIRGPFIELPNIIDEHKYKVEVINLKKKKDLIKKQLGINPDIQTWFCPARLEKIKGLHLILPLLEGIQKIKLLITGDGSEKESWQKIIDKYNLPVELLGYKQQEEMLQLYAVADLFILPSLSDPSPLSPIEAIAGGLPVLVSDKIGNFNQVYNGRNGWGINMDADFSLNRKLLQKIAGTPIKELENMGEQSNQLYQDNFNSQKLIDSYSDALLKLMKE